MAKLGRKINDECVYCHLLGGRIGRLRVVLTSEYSHMRSPGNMEAHSSPVFSAVVSHLACDNPSCGLLFQAVDQGKPVWDLAKSRKIKGGPQSPQTKEKKCPQCKGPIDYVSEPEGSECRQVCLSCFQVFWQGLVYDRGYDERNED